MEQVLQLTQIIIAISVAFVWVFRLDNVMIEFKQFGLSDLVRNFVGASKTILATLLVVGIWYQELIFVPAVIMGIFMIAAQYFHFKVSNPFIKHLPSLLLLSLCVFVAVMSAQ
jgi:hypothetical protein